MIFSRGFVTVSNGEPGSSLLWPEAGAAAAVAERWRCGPCGERAGSGAAATLSLTFGPRYRAPGVEWTPGREPFGGMDRG
jgi:hypothetical protein